ncbi:hypothetical protein WR25_19987 [Diploscapter pachys]|uniref:Aminopeptidase N-like N-terminal domain-containing protein n=1 Tax=Diploscapter pachys TaxID=2018661 RepID=A0A2A2KV80_9BILA|nr:hypothetical protein WR25_19987 [Diploscapter pachys]
MQKQACCNVRFYFTWLTCTAVCSLFYALIVFLALANKEVLPNDTIPSVIPYIAIPSLYNVTLNFNTTATRGNLTYTGIVLMHFTPITQVDRLFVNKGSQLKITMAYLIDPMKRYPVKIAAYDANYEIQAFICPFNLTMQQNYTLGMEFVGRLNDNGLRQVKYDDENSDNRYAISFGNQKIYQKGLRYVFPCLDTRDYPALLSAVILHSSTLRVLSNYSPITVQVTELQSQSFIVTSSPQQPSQFTFALTALQPQISQYQNITISAYYRRNALSEVYIPRQTQLMDAMSLRIGKLDVIVLPSITTVHRPGISLVNEDEAIQDVEARDDYPSKDYQKM